MTVRNLGGHIAFQRPDVAARTNLARLLVRTGSRDFGDSISASQFNKLILGRQAGRRRDRLVKALRKHLPDARQHGVAAGLHLFLELPGGAR